MITFRDPIFYKEVNSTNTILLNGDFSDGTVIVAESQLAGKGRRGRKWHSPPGKNLYLSILFKDPPMSATQMLQLNLVTAVGIVKTLEELSVPASIKWPNDILINEKKVAGILIESEMERENIKKIVIGIGINVNMKENEFPNEIKDIATSIQIATGNYIELRYLLKNLLQKLQLWYNIFEQEGFNQIKKEWENYFSWKGKEVIVFQGEEIIEGKAVGIDSNGFLIIKDQQGVFKTIIVGDITLRRKNAPGY